jgi:hypothetical protein
MAATSDRMQARLSRSVSAAVAAAVERHCMM